MKKNDLKLTKEMKAALKNTPAFHIEEIPELADFTPGPVVARGFAQFKEYINKNGRPKAEDPKVGISIRIPLSLATMMRATGPGWQTRMSEYIVKGIQDGALGKIEIQ